MTRKASVRRRGAARRGTSQGAEPWVLPVGLRGALAAAGALLAGLWLGVAVGLATRKRQEQPSGPPIYVGPGGIGGPEERAGG
jgi:hypothetical protein